MFPTFLSCTFYSSLLIVYEGYEEPKLSQQIDDDPLPDEPTTANVNVGTTNQGDSHVKPMEDDSHSGNCSYDADASNDSIELNLSLDEQHEQQPSNKQSYTSHTQSNHLPVSFSLRSILIEFFPFFLTNNGNEEKKYSEEN